MSEQWYYCPFCDVEMSEKELLEKFRCPFCGEEIPVTEKENQP